MKASPASTPSHGAAQIRRLHSRQRENDIRYRSSDAFNGLACCISVADGLNEASPAVDIPYPTVPTSRKTHAVPRWRRRRSPLLRWWPPLADAGALQPSIRAHGVVFGAQVLPTPARTVVSRKDLLKVFKFTIRNCRCPGLQIPFVPYLLQPSAA